MTGYSDTQLFINGHWRDGNKPRLPVLNPATGETIGTLANADRKDLDEALNAAQRGFEQWRKVGALDRSKLMRRAAGLLRERSDDIARLMTLEQGKPLVEAGLEAAAAADTIEWFAEESRRTYGRIL